VIRLGETRRALIHPASGANDPRTRAPAHPRTRAPAHQGETRRAREAGRSGVGGGGGGPGQPGHGCDGITEPVNNFSK